MQSRSQISRIYTNDVPTSNQLDFFTPPRQKNAGSNTAGTQSRENSPGHGYQSQCSSLCFPPVLSNYVCDRVCRLSRIMTIPRYRNVAAARLSGSRALVFPALLAYLLNLFRGDATSVSMEFAHVCTLRVKTKKLQVIPQS